MRLLVVAGVLLVGAVVAGAWVLPGMLDWNRFRGEIALLASDTLGRSVRIDGRITLTLLPQPTLTAAGVTIGGSGGGESGGGVSVTAKQLLLRVAFGPLLSGHVNAQELVLRGVDMHVPWPMQPDALVLHAPPWLSSVSASIEDGRLTVGSVVFTGIDATLATAADTGTYMAAGSATLSGHAWRFTARLSQPGGDGSAGLDLTLDGQGKVQGVGVSLSGQIAGDGSLVGRITGRGPDLSQLLVAPPVAFSANGRISVASGLAAADELAVELGGSPARGAVALRIAPKPRLDVALTASRLDLDAWLKALLRGPQGGVITGLPIGIDLSAEAGQLGGGTLRGLRADFDLASGVVEVRDLRATLPGDAALRAAGRITVPDPHAAPPQPGRFDGYVAVTAPSPRTTLAWLQGAGLAGVDRLPDGVLRRAELAGHVVVDPGQVAVDNLSGTINESAISGSLTLALGTRPRLGAGLTVDRLELDPLLPAQPLSLAAIPAIFAGFDANLRLEAKHAVLRGVTIAPLSLDAAVEGGQLTVRKLDGVINGVHAALSGTLGKGGRIGEGRLDVQAAQAAPLAALLPDRLAWLGQHAPKLWKSPVTLQVLGSGAPNALALKLTADVGDLRLEAQPTLDLATGKWTAAMTLRHPGAARLARTLGVPEATAWLGDGSFSLVAQLSGAGGRVAADSFDVNAGILHASGALALQDSGTGSKLTGQISAETLPLPLPALRSTDPLPMADFGTWQASLKLQAGHVLLGQAPALEQAAATLTLSDGVLRLKNFSAKLGGGALTGTLSLDARAQPPTAKLDAQLIGASLSGPLFGLPLDLTAGGLDANASLTASGYSPAALLATLGGSLHLTVLGGTLSGVDLGRATGELTDAAVDAALAGGSTPFDRLEATGRLDRGRLQLDQTRLTAPSGSIQFTGSINLPAAAADLRLALRPAVPDAPEIGLRLTGPYAAPQRTPELADVIRWRAAHPAPP